MCAALGVTTVVAAMSAAAAVGQGTFTRITSPSHDVTRTVALGKTNSFHVSGETSLDVSAVDIVCITFITGQQPDLTNFAITVPVSNGQFSTTAVYPSNPPVNCRLRAIPNGVDPTIDYLGAYTGPILYSDAFGVTKDGSSIPYSFIAYGEEGNGVGLLTDAGSCGTQAVTTIEAPQMVAGPLMIGCAFALAPSNISASGIPTASAVRVSGHNAYLPSGVHNYLIGSQSLAVTQPALTVSRQVAGNGDVTVTERATFMRCKNSDAYPPTTSSCPSLVSTGVSFQRVTEIFRNGHQARLRDTFASIDHHAHPVTLQYDSDATNQTAGNTATGSVGYIFPGHGATFRPAKLGQALTHLGAKAGTVLMRSDIYARTDDPQADTTAYTWSRGPSAIRYDANTSNVWGMSYAVTVPAGRVASLGFALSERWATADVKPLANAAVADMMVAPTITSPKPRARVHGRSTSVHGRLAAGANGLPTSVTVTGHRATITSVNPTTATYAVTFTESLGRHLLTATATDAAGNARSAAIRITNT
jgi:hypothetical protein